MHNYRFEEWFGVLFHREGGDSDISCESTHSSYSLCADYHRETSARATSSTCASAAKSSTSATWPSTSTTSSYCANTATKHQEFSW